MNKKAPRKKRRKKKIAGKKTRTKIKSNQKRRGGGKSRGKKQGGKSTKPQKIAACPPMKKESPFNPDRKIKLDKKLGVLFFGTVKEALAKLEEIKTKAQSGLDQLNVVISQEGNREIPQLTEIAKVFLG